MKETLRFTVEHNYSERDSEWFYDVVDHHLLRDRRVVGWYTAEPSWEGDRNYGYLAAKELADHLNNKYGWEYALEKRMNLKEAS